MFSNKSLSLALLAGEFFNGSLASAQINRSAAARDIFRAREDFTSSIVKPGTSPQDVLSEIHSRKEAANRYLGLVNGPPEAPLVWASQGANDILPLFKKYAPYIDNATGVITLQKIHRAIEDPRFQGDAAQLLFALKQSWPELKHFAMCSSTGRNGGITEQTVEALHSYFTRGFGTDDQTDRLIVALERNLSYARERITAFRTEAKNAASDPLKNYNADNQEQRLWGNCWFQGVLLGYDPRNISLMIQRLPDNSHEVRFPKGDIPLIRVAPLTDSELAFAAGVPLSGEWQGALEIALGKARMLSDPARANRYIRNDITAAQAGELGSPQDAMKLLLDSDGAVIELQGKTPEEIVKTIRDAVAAGKIVTALNNTPSGAQLRNEDPKVDLKACFIKPPEPSAPAGPSSGIIKDHAYNVGFPIGDEIPVRNPHRRNEPTDEHGAPLDGRDDGYFEQEGAVFARSFTKIIVSLKPQPAVHARNPATSAMMHTPVKNEAEASARACSVRNPGVLVFSQACTNPKLPQERDLLFNLPPVEGFIQKFR